MSTIKNKKGILLIIASIVIAVISVLTSVYLSSLVTEKTSVDAERDVLQALNLAEAGANLAFGEIKKRMPTDMNVWLNTANSTVIASYVDGNNPLGFLRDYAYASGAYQFTVAGNATLQVKLPNLGMGIDGDAVANITVTSAGNPTKDSADGPFRFFYNFAIESQGKLKWFDEGADNIKNTFDDLYRVNRLVAFSPNNFNLVVQHNNFAKFALFTSHHRTPSGTTVWFTANTNFNGPVHTNERFSFANNPSAAFTDLVTQSYSTARFYNNANSKTADSDRYPVGCTDDCRDKPAFNSGFSRSQTVVNLPTSVTQDQMKNDAKGTFSPPSNGIWIPNDGSSNLTAGIYIQGDTGSSSDNPTITMSVDGSNRPVYTIKRGTNTKQITVDYAANETIVSNIAGTGGTNPGTYQGVPNGTGHEGIIIYTNDNVGYWDSGHPSNNIAGLSGTVQEDTKITVASERDLMITSNIVYEKDPTIPGNEGYQNILGVISWNGNVRIGTDAPDDIDIYGVIMAPNPSETSGKGIFTVDNYDHGSPRGTATLLGGVISDYYGAFGTFSGGSPTSGYGRNFMYDERVLAGLVPPYFPYMSGFNSSVAPTDVFSTKTSWREK
jgi:hypothetical protein